MYGLEDESVPWGQISGYMLRAQALLRDRTAEEVHWGGLAVSWMLSEAVPELLERVDHGSFPPGVPIDPSFAALVSLRRYFVIDGMSYFPNATWPELLAAYAINCIGQAHGAFQYKRDLKVSENSHEVVRALDTKFFGDVLEAADAVHHAERIQEAREDATQEVELLFTEQQRDRGVKRHAKTRALIERFYVFYLTEGGGNRSHAARIFLKRLSPEDRKAFKAKKKESIIRTLTGNLRIYLRDHSRHDEDEA